MDVYSLAELLLKICLAVIPIWIFKYQIKRLVTSIIVGGDTGKFKDKSSEDITESIEEGMKEVLS